MSSEFSSKSSSWCFEDSKLMISRNIRISPWNRFPTKIPLRNMLFSVMWIFLYSSFTKKRFSKREQGLIDLISNIYYLFPCFIASWSHTELLVPIRSSCIDTMRFKEFQCPYELEGKMWVSKWCMLMERTGRCVSCKRKILCLLSYFLNSNLISRLGGDIVHQRIIFHHFSSFFIYLRHTLCIKIKWRQHIIRSSSWIWQRMRLVSKCKSLCRQIILHTTESFLHRINSFFFHHWCGKNKFNLMTKYFARNRESILFHFIC